MNTVVSLLRMLVLLAGISVFITPVFAVELPWSDRLYNHSAKNEPLKELIKKVAASQNTEVILVEGINDVVTQEFQRKTAKQIFTGLVDQYKLSWRYDGATLRVAKKEQQQVSAVILKYKTPVAFTEYLKANGVIDSQIEWVVSSKDSAVYFKGDDALVDKIQRIALVFDKKPSKRRIYKWVDENGTLTFSSTIPPRIEKSKQFELVNLR